MSGTGGTGDKWNLCARASSVWSSLAAPRIRDERVTSLALGHLCHIPVSQAHPGTPTVVLSLCQSQKRFLLHVEWMLNSPAGKASTLTRLPWSFHGFSFLFYRFSSLFSLFLLWLSLVVCSSDFQPFLGNSQKPQISCRILFSFPSLPSLPSQHPRWFHCFSWTLLMICHLWSAQSCGCWWGAPCSLWIFARYVESLVNLHKLCCSKTMQFCNADPAGITSPVEQQEGENTGILFVCVALIKLWGFLLFWSTLNHCCSWQSTINPLSCCD